MSPQRSKVTKQSQSSHRLQKSSSLRLWKVIVGLQRVGEEGEVLGRPCVSDGLTKPYAKPVEQTNSVIGRSTHIRFLQNWKKMNMNWLSSFVQSTCQPSYLSLSTAHDRTHFPACCLLNLHLVPAAKRPTEYLHWCTVSPISNHSTAHWKYDVTFQNSTNLQCTDR